MMRRSGIARNRDVYDLLSLRGWLGFSHGNRAVLLGLLRTLIGKRRKTRERASRPPRRAVLWAHIPRGSCIQRSSCCGEEEHNTPEDEATHRTANPAFSGWNVVATGRTHHGQ